MTAFTVAIRIDLVTLFPAMADGFLQESVIGKAIDKGLIEFKAHDLRAYSKDKHRKVDDMPYGGGPGMLMSCQPPLRRRRRPGHPGLRSDLSLPRR